MRSTKKASRSTNAGSRRRAASTFGLPNLVNRASSFIYGVWHDAKYVADHIVLQNEYRAYQKEPG
jgi:hypothetical protein